MAFQVKAFYVLTFTNYYIKESIFVQFTEARFILSHVSEMLPVKPLSVTTNVVGLQTDDAGNVDQKQQRPHGPRRRFAN